MKVNRSDQETEFLMTFFSCEFSSNIQMKVENYRRFYKKFYVENFVLPIKILQYVSSQNP